MRWLIWLFGGDEALMLRVAREIVQTAEGQDFARKFLAKETNKRLKLYKPLDAVFNYCD
jgi:hypothetical protein